MTASARHPARKQTQIKNREKKEENYGDKKSYNRT
mgnify:CR=1 FL=1